MVPDNRKNYSVSFSSSSSIELTNYDSCSLISSFIKNSINSSEINNNSIGSDNCDGNDVWSSRKMINSTISTTQSLTLSTATSKSVKSTDSFSPSLCPSEIRQHLNDELRYFFKNPMEKWQSTKAFPWKLFLQFVKLIVVTIHIISIGFEMSSFITKEKTMEATLRSLVFQDWDSSQELNSYPPARGPYAVYTKADFFGKLDFAIKSLATLTNEGVNLFSYDSLKREQVSPINLYIRQWSTSVLDPFSFGYDINSTQVHRNIPIETKLPASDMGWDSFSLQSYLSNHNQSIDFNSFIDINLVTHLRTIFFHSLTSYYYVPACYRVKVVITFDNSAHSGQIRLSLNTQCFRQPCYGNLSSSSESVTIINTYSLITWLVLIISTISFILCCRSLKFAWTLYFKVSKIAKDCYGTRLTADEEWKFIDIGILFILINDVLFALASIIKLSNTVRLNEDISLANRYSLIYGLGILVTWCNLLRYLNLFERFNIVIRTIQKASSDIFKFILVAAIIFTGYCLSGWIVLGPYHLKFATLSKTAECLFSLINADDMFATFASVRPVHGSYGWIIWWFSRLYIYSFVSLFIYFILNLFITIIIEARDAVQNPHSDYFEDNLPFLKKFLIEGEDIQQSGTSNDSDKNKVGDNQMS